MYAILLLGNVKKVQVSVYYQNVCVLRNIYCQSIYELHVKQTF